MLESEFDRMLAAARTNERWAWESLYRQFAPDVLKFLRMQRATQAEDVLGEVFVDVVRSLHTFDGSLGDFRSWLFRLAQNRLIDERRRILRRHERLVEDVPESPLPSTEEDVLVHEDEARFYRLLSALGEDQRSAVFMRFALDMQPAEIAKILDRRVGSVKMLIRRGLDTLKGRL